MTMGSGQKKYNTVSREQSVEAPMAYRRWGFGSALWKTVEPMCVHVGLGHAIEPVISGCNGVEIQYPILKPLFPMIFGNNHGRLSACFEKHGCRRIVHIFFTARAS